MNPTPYPNLNGLLGELVGKVSAALGSSLVGAYLQGSLAVGDFDQLSDIDFVVVTETDLTSDQVDALNRVHEEIYALRGKYAPDCPCPLGPASPDRWETSLEGSYFPRGVLRPWTGTSPLWYLDNGATRLERNDHDNNLVARWALRERGVVLCGPSPASLVDPVDPYELRREVLEDMQFIVADFADSFWNSRFGQPYAVLNFCRMLMTMATAEIHSKKAGVAWALGALDSRWSPLVERAWAARGKGHVSEAADPAEYAETILFIEAALPVAERFLLQSR